MSGWVKVENTMPEDPKLPGLSDRAFRLWICALCYCSRGETDGRVPKALMVSLSVTGNKAAVNELLSAAMLADHGGEYEVVNYLKFNLSKAEIAELREQGRKRAAKSRQARRNSERTPKSQRTYTEPPLTRASGSGEGVVEQGSQGQGRLTREIVDGAITILSGRWTVIEEAAIENVAAMYPEVDVLQGARLAATWASDPTWEIDSAAASLRAAMNKLDREEPKADEKASRRKRRGEAMQSLLEGAA